MLVALIMAGGKGTRFWPLSTEEKPKQFLHLIGNETMLQKTVNRIISKIPIEKIFICTGEKYVDLVKEQIPNILDENIIVEPEARNTTACITASSLIIKRRFPNSNVVVLPADHLINDEEKFNDILQIADGYLAENNKSIITLGMKPTRAETGYGYIEISSNISNTKENNILDIKSFKEKPNKNKAIEYLNSGNYLWNGGIFFWNIDTVLFYLSKYTSKSYNALKDILFLMDEDVRYFIKENYKYTDKISIDYAVLEKANNLKVIYVNIGWDDVGSWEAVERYSEKDKNGNIHYGDISSLNGINNLVIATKQKVIIDDVSDIYVIENNGKIVIGKKTSVNKIKNLKEMV